MCLKGPVENIYGINRHQIEKTQNDHILYLCIDRYVLGTLYNSEMSDLLDTLNEWILETYHVKSKKKDTDYL